MPDWSYRTLFQPLLFALRASAARDVTLRAVRALANTPAPFRLIEFMGHSRPASDAAVEIAGVHFPARVGIGAGLDVHVTAYPALAQLGVGFIEVGPVSLKPIAEKIVERQSRSGNIFYEEPLANDGAVAVKQRLIGVGDVRLGVRVAHSPIATPEAAAAECFEIAQLFAEEADFLTYDTRAAIRGAENGLIIGDIVASAARAIRTAAPNVPLFILLPPDLNESIFLPWLQQCELFGIAGIVIAGGVTSNGGRLAGSSTFDASIAAVECIRERFGSRLAIIASGGILQPTDALAMLDAGADLVQIHSGLVYTGPNLAKRIVTAAPANVDTRAVRGNAGWIWICLMGMGIATAGVLGWIMGSTRIILPYDEHFLGLTLHQIARINRLLPAFMRHDRVSYAGAILSVGLSYVFLSIFGMRVGISWTRRIIVASSVVGFASFLLFLGIHYFDPLHAAGTLIFLLLFVLGIGSPRTVRRLQSQDLRNDSLWRRSLWGQLCFVFLGFGFLVGGIAICAVGTTTLFVPSDLAFMHTTRAALEAASTRLIPVLAHDRAYFGGALIVNGIIWLLAALWGFDRGARWQWWMFACCGVPGFLAALEIHFNVGYTDAAHLLPVYFALILWMTGLLFSYRYLNEAIRH